MPLPRGPVEASARDRAHLRRRGASPVAPSILFWLDAEVVEPRRRTAARPDSGAACVGESAIAGTYHADAAQRYANIVIVLHNADAVPCRCIELELVFVVQSDAITAYDAIEGEFLNTEIERRQIEVLSVLIAPDKPADALAVQELELYRCAHLRRMRHIEHRH